MRNHLLALAFLTALAAPCQALDIQLFDVGTTPMSAAQRSAFNAAAESWENALADQITVRINVGFNDLGTSLGNTWVARTTHPLPAVRTALFFNAASFEEAQRSQKLPIAALPIVDIHGPRFDNKITMATANAKALGLSVGLDPFYGEALENQADAKLLFNNKFTSGFDYDATDGIDTGNRDFTALAAREIGHALGFKSSTDIQDLPANDPHVVHPSTLDLFRFRQTTFPHNLTTEHRIMTSAPAEYFDTRMEKGLSWGRLATDPECDVAGDHCLASYWRDGGEDTMDPTLPRGKVVELSAADIQAFDTIGYQRPSVFDPRKLASISKLQVGWFQPEAAAPCLGCELPTFPRGAFDEFEPAPEFSVLPESLRGADFNLGIQIGIDLGVDGMRNRSGIGFATFREEIANRERFTYAPLDPVVEEQNLLPAVQVMESLPPSIMDFYFRSDKTGGAPFTFIAELGEDGAPFDPTIGDFGGYRITGFLDGEADGVLGDTDGRLTFLLAADGEGDPDGGAMSLYKLSASTENAFFDADGFAFEFGFFVPGDTYPFDGKVDVHDLNNVRNNFGEEGEFGTPGDTPRFDGKVDIGDLNAVRNNFGYGSESPSAVPEPGTVGLLVVLLASLGALRARGGAFNRSAAC
jgi:hypothetical protein